MMSRRVRRAGMGLVAAALVALLVALAGALVGSPRAQAQAPPLCPEDPLLPQQALYLAIGPPTLSVTASPATIDANSGTSLIEARPLNALGNPPIAGCEVALGTDLGSFASTGGSTASVLTNTPGVATDSFQCDGVVGTATITATISLPLPNNIGPTMTATTQVECTAAGLPDLWVEKSHQPEPFEYGGQGQITLTVTNNGPGTATLFTLVDFLHGGLTAVSVSNSDWQCNLPPAFVVDCVYVGPPLGPNDTATLVITVSVGSAAELPDPFENCARVTLLGDDGAPIDDADPSNDEGCDLITVVASSGGGGLWLDKVDQDGNPVPGAGFSITGGGVVLPCTTDAQGKCHFEGLAAGDYEIKETLIPAGYTFLGCEPNPATVPREGQVTVTCRNERTGVEVPDLGIAKSHRFLDIFVQDDTGVDYLILTCPGCAPTTFAAGTPDGFALPSEPSSPRPALLQRIQNCSLGALQAFDPVPDNRCFGHTLSGLPKIGAAGLEIRLRAHPTDSLTDTDALALQLSADGTTFAWSLSLNALIEWATGGSQLIWTPGSDFTFSLDLAALPLDASGSTTTSILDAINDATFAFGGQAQFALTVTNNGPGPAGGFVVTDNLPPGFAFDSHSNTNWSCSVTSGLPFKGQTVTCVYIGPPLDPGESATVLLTVAVGDPSDFTGGPVLNPVSIDVDNCATVALLDAAGTVMADLDPSNDTVCDRVVMEGAAEAAGMVTVQIPAGTSIVSFPVPVTSAELIAAIPDLIVWVLCDGVWEVDARLLPPSLRMNIAIPVGSGIIAITETGGVLRVLD